MREDVVMSWSPFFPVAIAGESMRPTLGEGEWWLARRTTIRREGDRPARDIRAGDIVVFTHPRGDGLIAIKRVVLTDPAGLWVEGDNPQASTDSRQFGLLPRDRVLGRLLWRYSPWPPRRPGPRPPMTVVD